jgi:hypothetical protein
VVSSGQSSYELEVESYRSIRELRRLERETGVAFFHEVGCLSIEAGKPMDSTCIEDRWPFLASCDSMAGEGASAIFQPADAGWINHRAHVRATLARCRTRGVHMISEFANSVTRCVTPSAA